jgi:hypothetical protein
VNVLHEILAWSHDRPAWQREALRRLVLNQELADEDISALTEICKSGNGLAEQRDCVPLASRKRGRSSSSRTMWSSFYRFGNTPKN